MWVAKVEAVIGVKVFYPRPVIDGFRFKSKNGKVVSLAYRIEPIRGGFFYRFTPPLRLKGDEEGWIQFHSSEDIDEYVDMEIVAVRKKTQPSSSTST